MEKTGSVSIFSLTPLMKKVDFKYPAGKSGICEEK
jgi:hypothetical protein